MNIKFWPVVAASAIFGLFSCTDELSDNKVENNPTESIVEIDVDDVESPAFRMKTREIIVEFDDATAVELCKEEEGFDAEKVKRFFISTKAASVAELPVMKMERVFPDAGEWEERHREAGLHRFFKITCAEPVDVENTTAALMDMPEVTTAEMAVPIKPTAGVPFNDPYVKSYQWQYYNDGTMYDGYVKGSDINVVPVWEQYTGGKSNVIVSIVDQGIQMNHPDLSGVVLAGGANGSKNFVDYSYNITAGDHGCHVAGIVGGINNNGKGICGVAGGLDGKGGVTMMSCQIFAGNSGGSSSDAIVWGADHGAVISQNSWGYNYDYNDDGELTGYEYQYAMSATISSADKAAVDYFIKNAGCDKNGNQLENSPMKGGIVIFAAGNDNIENGAPANYSPILAVGAIGPDAKRASYSNFGSWVDICAPGGEASRFSSDSKYRSYILSCVSNSTYAFMCGTSMACPMVSGVAALVVSQFGGPGFTNTQLRNILEESSNKTIISSSDKIAGLVDAYAAFKLAETGVSTNHNPEITTAYTGDYKALVGENLTIDYKATDQDGDVCTFTISGDGSATVASTGSNTCRVTINATSANVGTHKATLKADDGKAGYATVEINYTIVANHAPKIELVGTFDPKVSVGATPKVSFKITDEDGDDVTVSLSGDTAAKLSKGTDGNYVVSISAIEANVGKHKAVISAKDSHNAETTYDLEYEIYVNHSPIIEAQGTLDAMIPTGKNVTMDYKVSDYDGDAITVTLSGDGSATLDKKSSDTYTLTIYATEKNVGKHKVTIKAVDVTKLQTTLPVEYEIYINYPPVISTDYKGNYVSLVGKQQLAIDYSVTDQNNDVCTVTLSSDGSSTLTKISETQYRLYILNNTKYVGQHTATIKADDGKGGVTEKTVDYSVVNNHAPTISAKGSIDTDIAVGQNVTLDYAVEDSDGDVLDVQLDSDGSSELKKKQDGVYTLSFKAEQSRVGNHKATITVTDPYGESATASLSYKIYVNQPPVIDISYSPAVENNTTLYWYQTRTVTFTATDPENKSPLTLDIASNQSAVKAKKVSDSKYTVAMEGDGKFHGTCVLKATATDAIGAKAEKEITYNVLENRAPQVKKNFRNLLFKELGDKTTMNLNDYFSDPDEEEMTYTLEVVSGDAVSLSNSGNTYYIRASKKGASVIKVVAKDGFGATTEVTFQVGVFNDEEGPAIGPNPVKDYLTIRVGAEKAVKFQLLDENTAKVIMEVEGTASIYEPMKIDMRSVAPGRYLAKVEIEGTVYERQIVKL